jgi:molecular chaperone DnaJ
MASPDLYDVLGVPHDVTPEDLKRAYRKLARELHPDANPHEPTAEARFKEVSQAYEILSDPERRANYDRFGSADGMGGGFNVGSVQDIFDMFFGNVGGMGRRRGPQPGPDAEVAINLSLEDAAFGVTRDVEVMLAVGCETCAASGAAPGTSPSRCEACGGSGEVRQVRQSFLGQMVMTAPCSRCYGAGQVISSPCPKCHGDGRVTERRTLTVEIPAGVEEGSTMRLTGRGPVGPRGGPSGTLFLHLHVTPDERFERAGDDLHHLAEIELTQAVLGASIEVPTLKGTETIEIAPGSQPGTVITLRHEGVHHLRGRGRGDLYVHLVVKIPTHLDDRSEELVRELATHLGHEVSEPKGSLLSRLRGAKR